MYNHVIKPADCTLWESEPELDARIGARFRQSNFDRDLNFFLLLNAGHPGTADWPCSAPRLRFPAPPGEMDDCPRRPGAVKRH